VGALPIFVRSAWSKNAQRLMLALAGGMMLGATSARQTDCRV